MLSLECFRAVALITHVCPESPFSLSEHIYLINCDCAVFRSSSISNLREIDCVYHIRFQSVCICLPAFAVRQDSVNKLYHCTQETVCCCCVFAASSFLLISYCSNELFIAGISNS